MIALVVALPAGLMLAGCLSSGTQVNSPAFVSPVNHGSVFGSYASAKLNDIRIGMSRDEVVSILGTPDSKAAQANVEYMIYYLDTDSNVRDRSYMIRLVSGRVESFGRFTELVDLYNRPVANSVPGQPNIPQPVYAPADPRSTGAPTAVARGQAVSVDLADELETLKALKDQGVLNAEEFQAAKARLLSPP